jgi:hypothetical protein
MFGRRPSRSDATVTDDLGARVVSLVLDEDAGTLSGRAAREQAWAELRAILAEAVIWQDAANEVLAAISRREPLAEVAPRGGPLVRRFCELSARLPESDDPELQRITGVLGPVLHHHALMLSSSLDMLAVDWRSERIAEELERITGLGAPARRLDELYAQVCAGGATAPIPQGRARRG